MGHYFSQDNVRREMGYSSEVLCPMSYCIIQNLQNNGNKINDSTLKCEIDGYSKIMFLKYYTYKVFVRKGARFGLKYFLPAYIGKA